METDRYITNVCYDVGFKQRRQLQPPLPADKA